MSCHVQRDGACLKHGHAKCLKMDLPPVKISVWPMESIVSVDVQVKMGENLTNLVSQHDKHHKDPFNFHVKDKTWFETQPLGFNEDDNVAHIHLLPPCVRHRKGLATTASISIKFGVQDGTYWASFMKPRWSNLFTLHQWETTFSHLLATTSLK